jgi:hypothetical protein
MHIIYDYMLMAGDENWSATPAAVIATRDDKPLPVLNGTPVAPVAAAPTPAPKPAVPVTRKPQ